MSDYLKNLQDSNTVIHGFVRDKKMPKEVSLLESELREEVCEELSDILTEEEISEIEIARDFMGGVVARLSQGEATVAGLTAAAAIIYMATKAFSFAASYPECRKYSAIGMKKKCNWIIAHRKRLDVLKTKITLCNNSKDPAKCQTKVKAKIQAEEAKLKELGTIEGTK